MELKKIQDEVSKFGFKKNLNLELKSPEEKAILIQTVKLNEEVGELCNDILSILQLQRASKLERFEKDNIYQEFADVLITLLQLAQYANVDVERAVKDKLKKIKEKYK
ncbi:MAG TPA: MazG nucleotide pyrophosphohydrolase domain-containing protein [Candidatus Woesebacteria bacterium]|nr:MazG nucleotide pyrophosphohydrolase domain-containing protein [Candidatus Woesebacteria bacterium]